MSNNIRYSAHVDHGDRWTPSRYYVMGPSAEFFEEFDDFNALMARCKELGINIYWEGGDEQDVV